jgi:hypothetical protein
VSYFSQTKLTQETGASMRATYTIKGGRRGRQLIDGGVESVKQRL